MASANSLAITLASVAAGLNSDAEISAELPITIATAIVSPSARPSPRIIAPITPVMPYGITAVFTISHLVAPSASAASRCVCGTTRKTSVQTDEIYGMIMIARITPADSMPTDTFGPWKNGSQPK